MSVFELVDYIRQNPLFLFSIILTLLVILVNGWTDAPNAIATCVSTRAIKPKNAIVMAAVCNFFGVVLVTLINSKVAMTIYNMVDFDGNVRNASVALAAALVAIVLWAVFAWMFGIPTSESHALIAGLSGAAIALHNSVKGIHINEWAKVLYGLVFSTVFGLLFGYVFSKLMEQIFKNADPDKVNGPIKGAQVIGGALMAFLHGAQDGQKFMGVFLLSISLAAGRNSSQMFDIPLWLMVLCSLVMGFGTSIGGYRIIKSVGMEMVRLKPYQGLASDLSGAICLLIASVTGMPVSTTHTKTTAIMGVGMARRVTAVNWGIVKEMVLTWVFTFPGCGLLGYIMAKALINL